MSSTPTIPPLADDEVHLWRTPWSGGAGETRFAELLATYAGPDAPAIARAEHGKPYFPAPHDTLGFSWSHSGDVALLAVARGPAGFQIGVDVETVRPRPRALELSRRFFAPAETAWLESLPEADRLGGFLTLWTAKEAVLKAHGGGLSYGLHRVAFAVRGGRATPASFDGEVAPIEAWQVHPLSLGEGLVAAVAWRDGERAVRVFTSAL
ncbi:MAG: 4'-phosphopantetheinyl transferase superfamily protein [Luteibacter sp.]